MNASKTNINVEGNHDQIYRESSTCRSEKTPKMTLRQAESMNDMTPSRKESMISDSVCSGVKLTLLSKGVKMTLQGCYSGNKCWTPFKSQNDSLSFLCVYSTRYFLCFALAN